jgi:molecular chaperone HscC
VSTPPIIGIDLGTTHSLCAVFQNGKPRLIRNASGGVLTPSIVGVLPEGRVVVGNAARELRVSRPERCAATFKRWMGTDREISIGPHSFSAPQLSSLVLHALKTDAEADFRSPVHEAVITVPAYFNDHQRQATKLAGELAGLKVRRIVNEPTAAALTYGFHDRHASKRILVFDLGGGTFDVTLMEVFEGTLEIVATSGESFLGGEDFTDRLIALALERQGLELESTELSQPSRVARLREECERAKRELGTADSALIRLPDELGNIAPALSDPPRESECVRVTADEFAARCADLVQRLAVPVTRVMNDAQCGLDGIAEVILVGGATRMPIVARFVEQTFGKQPLCAFNPDEVVALGAAIQAALIADDQAVEDMVLTDVCPFTLGIGIAKRFGSEIREGYYLPIIDRNTTIPVSKEQSIFTLHPDQTSVKIQVFQGDARRTENNLVLGELTVTGIPRGPAGRPVQVRFTYDLNGLLEVEAFVPETREHFRTLITQSVKGLSPDEIARAAKELAKLKFYPRDEIPNQELVLFAERVVGELSPVQRESLEQPLDEFERAMVSGDRERFEAARQALLITLSSLGHPFVERRDGS